MELIIIIIIVVIFIFTLIKTIINFNKKRKQILEETALNLGLVYNKSESMSHDITKGSSLTDKMLARSSLKLLMEGKRSGIGWKIIKKFTRQGKTQTNTLIFVAEFDKRFPHTFITRKNFLTELVLRFISIGETVEISPSFSKMYVVKGTDAKASKNFLTKYASFLETQENNYTLEFFEDKIFIFKQNKMLRASKIKDEFMKIERIVKGFKD